VCSFIHLRKPSSLHSTATAARTCYKMVVDSGCALTIHLAEHRYSTVHELHVMLFLIACTHILYVTLSLGLCEIAVRIAADPSASAPRSAFVLGIHCTNCR